MLESGLESYYYKIKNYNYKIKNYNYKLDGLLL